MAALAPITATLLLRVGDGVPTEIASLEVPLRAVLHREEVGTFASLNVQVDLATLHENLRAALLEAVDGIPRPYPLDEDPVLTPERAELLARWDAFRQQETCDRGGAG